MNDNTASVPAITDPVYPAAIVPARNDGAIDEPDYSRERQKPDFVQADDNNFEGA